MLTADLTSTWLGTPPPGLEGSCQAVLYCRDPLAPNIGRHRLRGGGRLLDVDEDTLDELRMLAIRQRLDGVVRADLLIEAAVRALVEDADSPSLSRLAGLSRREEPEAQELFKAVVNELDIAPPDPAEGRWQLVRWWCREIVGGRLRPEVGGRLIWFEGWQELGYPDSLQPVVAWTSEWEDWGPDWGVDREEYERKIMAEAETLLAEAWPPK